LAKILDPDFEFNADFGFKQDLRNLFLQYTYHFTNTYNYLRCYNILMDMYDRLYPKLNTKAYEDQKKIIDAEFDYIDKLVRPYGDFEKLPKQKHNAFVNALRKINQQIQVLCQDKGYWLPDKSKGKNVKVIKSSVGRFVDWDGNLRDNKDGEK